MPEIPTPLSFSAVLLAGGASRRMGRDKALLAVPGSDRPLWQRQWRLLEELQPEELFWSGPPRPEMPDGIRFVADAVKNAGPLAGISACLDVMRTDWLVVLAIDLPQMSGVFLRGLLARCGEGVGVVACRDDFFEPLAAVYPRQLRLLAAGHLAQGRYAMQDFIGEAAERKLLQPVLLAADEVALFKNLNAPSDLSGTGRDG